MYIYVNFENWMDELRSETLNPYKFRARLVRLSCIIVFDWPLRFIHFHFRFIYCLALTEHWWQGQLVPPFASRYVTVKPRMTYRKQHDVVGRLCARDAIAQAPWRTAGKSTPQVLSPQQYTGPSQYFWAEVFIVQLKCFQLEFKKKIENVVWFLHYW